MSTVFGVSSLGSATAFFNQRKIDRCSNGVLIAVICYSAPASVHTQIIRVNYSTDDGATWSFSGTIDNGSGLGTTSFTENVSFFIDLDDYAHVVFKDNNNGYLYYRRGTPNAGRTVFTWSAATVLETSNTSYNYPDIVAHREGSGWAAHIVSSWNDGTNAYVLYHKISITSTGTISKGAQVIVTGPVATSVQPYPSIDFNHTGDGKTVAGGTPHLYIAWSAGKTGAGFGIRFKKVNYSAGTWAWSAEVELDPNRYTYDTSHFLNCVFDGTAVIVGGLLYNGTNSDFVAYERNVANTLTTTLEIATYNEMFTTKVKPYLTRGQLTYDGSRNINIPLRLPLGGSPYGSTSDMGVAIWNRATGAWSFLKTGLTNTANSTYVSAKRGYSSNKIEYVYMEPSSGGYFPVSYTSINYVPGPSGPTISVWSGSAEISASAKIWDGSTEQPVTLEITA